MKIIVDKEAEQLLSRIGESAVRGAGMLLVQGGLRAANDVAVVMNSVTTMGQAMVVVEDTIPEKPVDTKTKK